MRKHVPSTGGKNSWNRHSQQSRKCHSQWQIIAGDAIQSGRRADAIAVSPSNKLAKR
jgi:hypothetical protein